jgi:hypothetical protein
MGAQMTNAQARRGNEDDPPRLPVDHFLHAVSTIWFVGIISIVTTRTRGAHASRKGHPHEIDDLEAVQEMDPLAMTGCQLGSNNSYDP